MFEDLKYEYKLETGLVLAEGMDLLLADLPYSTRDVRNQSSSAHNVFSKKSMKNLVMPMGSVMAFQAHNHILCWDLLFYH